MTAATMTHATAELTRQDRCDRCGAQAFARATLPGAGGVLLFCGHHFRAHEAALVGAGAQIHDERHRLEQEVRTPER